jgi:hypothetical protein
MTQHEALELLRDALKGITRENLEDVRRAVRSLQRTQTTVFQDADSIFSAANTFEQILINLASLRN